LKKKEQSESYPGPPFKGVGARKKRHLRGVFFKKAVVSAVVSGCRGYALLGIVQLSEKRVRIQKTP